MMWLCVGFFLIGSAIAQVPIPGTCPEVQTMKDFDVVQYFGKWYEAERYFSVAEFGGKCATATYTSNPNGTVHVLNEMVSTLTGSPVSIEGYATQNAEDKAKLSVVFTSLPIPTEAPLWILGTDYTSYSVVWSCTQFGIVSTRSAWVLTREPLPAESVIEKAYQVIDSNNINKSFFVQIDQVSCNGRSH